MIFNNKKKNASTGTEKSDVAKKYNFRISTPNGYFPEDVDKIIMDLEKQIANLSNENVRLEEQNVQLKEDFRTVEKANQQMRLQILTLESVTNDLQDFSNLEKLANINPDVGDLPGVKPVEPTRAEIPLDILGDSSPVFDNLISDEKPKVKMEVKENKNRPLADIYSADGQLEIL